MKEVKEGHPSLTWIYPAYNPEWRNSIVKEFKLHPAIAQAFVSRKFSTLEEIYQFLYAKLPNLHPPELFMDMDKAVFRVVRALYSKEPILIYGDNDVDGITGTAILVEFLRQIGGESYYYISHRTPSNSSIITDALEYAKYRHCKLWITVDCGITATKEIEEVLKRDIDVIISDHHEPMDKMPRCIAALNPKLYNNPYPDRELTGAGVAFKLAHALINYLISEGKLNASDVDLKHYLDLVAFGTVADMGILIGENRILVRYGLKQFANTKRVGLIKLMEMCDIDPIKINTSDITSKIAPRLNSLGRIADPLKGVELMLVSDIDKAQHLVQELEDNNLHRQHIERRDTRDVEAFIHVHPQILKDRAIALHSHMWHEGIVPIIATRISRQYNRPTLIIAVDEAVGKGSIRTIPEFPLLPILHEISHYLVNFGGHDFAAGFIIKNDNILEVKKAFVNIANHTLKEEDLLPKLHLDSKIHFEDLTFDFLDSIQLFEPYGNGNPSPILYSDVAQIRPPKVVGKIHLKFYLEQNGRALEGMGFGLNEQRKMLIKKNTKLQIAFTPYTNLFCNKPSIQLLIKDIKNGSKDHIA